MEALYNAKINKRQNCFNLIRLIAALQVFLGHSVTHLKLYASPSLNTLISLLSGVPIFFFLSGFLIWDSINRSKNFKIYAKKRLFRLFPELWVGVAINAIVVVIFAHESISWLKYILFQGAQATILQFWTPSFLKGYGAGAPNGSLWTIGVMIQSYIVLWFLFKLLHKKSLLRWIIALAISIGFNVFMQYSPNILPEMVDKLYSQTFLPYIWMFILGGFISEYFDQCIEFLKKYWLLLFVVALLARDYAFDLGYFKTLYFTLLNLSLVGFAYYFTCVKIKVDLSYGIYIYHMIVVNVMVELGFVGHWWQFIIALLIVTALALASYYSIGAVSRKLKNRNTQNS